MDEEMDVSEKEIQRLSPLVEVGAHSTVSPHVIPNHERRTEQNFSHSHSFPDCAHSSSPKLPDSPVSLSTDHSPFCAGGDRRSSVRDLIISIRMFRVKSGCCCQTLERSSLIAGFYTSVRDTG